MPVGGRAGGRTRGQAGTGFVGAAERAVGGQADGRGGGRASEGNAFKPAQWLALSNANRPLIAPVDDLHWMQIKPRATFKIASMT